MNCDNQGLRDMYFVPLLVCYVLLSCLFRNKLVVGVYGVWQDNFFRACAKNYIYFYYN